MNKKYFMIVSVVIVFNLFIDRISKIVASLFLKGEEIKTIFFGIVKLVYVENTGAFLSLGSGWPTIIKYIVLIIVPLTFCVYGTYYCIIKSENVIKMILLSTIIGGGLGNIIDRLLYDFRVIDFLNFSIGNIRTGILNVADISVTFGAILLLIYEKSKTHNVDKTA